MRYLITLVIVALVAVCANAGTKQQVLSGWGQKITVTTNATQYTVTQPNAAPTDSPYDNETGYVDTLVLKSAATTNADIYVALNVSLGTFTNMVSSNVVPVLWPGGEVVLRPEDAASRVWRITVQSESGTPTLYVLGR